MARQPKPKAEDRQFVTALARGLDVLRCFTERRPILGTTDIAALTGLPQPTVWRLCHTLVEAGYLVPVPKGDKLRIGAAVLSLGYAARASLGFLQIARPHMQEMADRYHAAVALAEPHRTSMVYLERCQGQSMLLMNLQVGSRIATAYTATGCAYLAGLPAARREALLDQIARKTGDDWPQVKTRIALALKAFDRQGFIVNTGLNDTGVAAVAAPVVSPDGRTVLSLNCGGPASVLTQELMNKKIGPELVVMARMLGAELPARYRRGQ